MVEQFRGTGVAIVTPFHDSGNVDFGSLERLLDHVVSNGVDYIVVLGTTGESVTLSKDEKTAVLNFVSDTVNKRVPLVAGIGGNSTQEVINTIRATSFEGIDAILSVSPYYNKPQQRGIYSHYKAISTASPVPVILYNVPGRTSSNISAETTLKLAHDLKNIIGIKEASGNLIQIMEIIQKKPSEFLVLSGDDALTLPLLAVGADGVISVVANAFPREFSEMVNFGLKGKFSKAMEIHYGLLEFTNALFMDGSPSGIKMALEIMNICKSYVRLPLVKVNKTTQSLLENLVETIQKQNLASV
jgi:4-hydroxy-tetrahydrodipicolinate synthase